MFIDMILKAIPKSLRAGVALVVLFVFLGTGLTGLQQLLTPGEDSLWTIIKTVGGLIIGFTAGIMFYYFQAKDGEDSSSHSDLDTMDKYYKSERQKQKMRDVEITPAYPSEEHHSSKKPD